MDRKFGNLYESFLGDRERGGFNAKQICKRVQDGQYEALKVIAACVAVLDEKQKLNLACKLAKQLASDGMLKKAVKSSKEFSE